MYRTSVILSHTFREAIVQPIYSLLIGLGAVILIIFAKLPFFTLGEDTVMYMSVGLDVVLILVLLTTLFATSKSIFDEIEDRTMLTLMSKPIQRFEVIIGKYLGIIAAALLAIVILGGVLCLTTALRIPGDYMISQKTLDDSELRQMYDLQKVHIAGLCISLFQVWLQVSVLAAVSVALSTRFSMVVNLPVVVFIYIAGNLTRFLKPGNDGLMAGRNFIVKTIAYLVRAVLPYLEAFDLKSKTIYGKLAVGPFKQDPNAISLSIVGGYVGLSMLYAVFIVTFFLSIGLLMFQTRELGGAEG